MTWAERRKHDLMRSHSAALRSINEDRANRLERLVDQQIEYEALAHAMEKQGATAEEMERIEDACWPVRECLRQLHDEMPPFHRSMAV